MRMDNKSLLELGSEPVGKLLMRYAVPAIIAMTASSAYNIIDGIFIGQGVGPEAITGLALTLPLMTLLAAFGAMIGVGASTLLSVKLGERDYSMAEAILGNEVALNVLLGIGMSVLILPVLSPILCFFGADSTTLPFARDFMQIILIGNISTHLYLGLNAMLRSISKPQLAMRFTIATVLLNVILAPLFIFVFRWGIRGAAIATVLAQTIVLLCQIRVFCNPQGIIYLHRGIYRLQRRIIMGMVSIGVSPFLINLCSCLLVIIINRSMVAYGTQTTVGAFGIVNRLVFLVIMVIIGLNQGMQPIAGYNYGARKYDRLISVLKKTTVFATLISTLGFLVGMFFPEACARAFTTDEELIKETTYGFRITVMFFPLIGMQMVVTNFFQSIGQAGKSIFLSLTRQLLFLLPLVSVLPLFFGLTGVWYSMPLSDFIASIVAFVMITYTLRSFKRKEREREAVEEKNI